MEIYKYIYEEELFVGVKNVFRHLYLYFMTIKHFWAEMLNILKSQRFRLNLCYAWLTFTNLQLTFSNHTSILLISEGGAPSYLTYVIWTLYSIHK